MKKTITIFGSSIPKAGEEEYETAYKLGALLAKNGFDLCSGGYRGIMEAVSKGAVDNGRSATGITLSYADYLPNKYLTKEIKCDTLFDRISKLIEMGDGYVVLTGGTGTLLELASVWEFMNKKLMLIKPIACHSKMWKDIGYIIDKQIEREKRVSGLVKYFNTSDEIAEYLSRVI